MIHPELDKRTIYKRSFREKVAFLPQFLCLREMLLSPWNRQPLRDLSGLNTVGIFENAWALVEGELFGRYLLRYRRMVVVSSLGHVEDLRDGLTWLRLSIARKESN